MFTCFCFLGDVLNFLLSHGHKMYVRQHYSHEMWFDQVSPGQMTLKIPNTTHCYTVEYPSDQSN